ncbi:hypothetical protein PUNSTDRAFT_134321 [Punctularia strigosozonata HHB-11173 SS5]|uniref:Uncharacterized protein n=1 Tax=Punctularia strigosozonata (strain HHB-11173) TaxID=741275 RepID=R7RYU9_PUNST|nr:uncharacterized protein PUNSTDRAFT_134321 [Punctularia strigosozonata HHB-11173 SS5]XP_007389486.1 uncharacterized protein PUNSTDRAFT_139691 [Punctularia strigosozonata HHB-11173 SS5]EIN03285.1 hypothetical protein PUNSTDRAFT_139691 [Punctularia strigosozonata HHB-11173 SS5]EIN09156.1 hypothetical protein PUNSTDRAFT_134321 [Punctularia strigosozonata HHB-11173 SS5]
MKLNQSLQSKEDAKNTERRNKYMVGGMARHFTHKGFIAEEERLEAIAKEKEAQKEQRETARKQKRHVKEAFEEWWRMAKEEYSKDRSEYEEMKKRLISEGVKCKDLPKAPQKPKKADYPKETEDLDDSESDDSTSSKVY